MTTEFQSDYYVGGTVPLEFCYIPRQADQDLYEVLKASEFCYVLNSRQMGKSSLALRTMEKLREEDGIVSALVDISPVGDKETTKEGWFRHIIEDSLTALLPEESFDTEDWWKSYESLPAIDRWRKFVEEKLLSNIPQKIVIFIDEIDSVLSLQFSYDDFFAQIRAFHNRRASQPDYQRLTFCLLGVVSPSDLIRDKQRTPFNIGRAIELTDFQFNEAQDLVQGLEEAATDPKAVLQTILDWTGGQPFLTQKICKLVQDKYTGNQITDGQESEEVRKLVQEKILKNWEDQDQPVHLRYIRDRVYLKGENRARQLLSLYQKLLDQGSIPADNTPEQAELKLSGLVVKRDGFLRTYNPIYERVFDKQWVAASLEKLKRIINNRYEMVAELGARNNVKTYRVKDLRVRGEIERILKEIDFTERTDSFEMFCKLFEDQRSDLQDLNKSSAQIPAYTTDFETDGKFYYLVQEIVIGYNLDDEIKGEKLDEKSYRYTLVKSRPWDESDVEKLLNSILETLKVTHDRNLFHLNLNPSNIRIREQDQKFVLIDFAIFEKMYASTHSDKPFQPWKIGKQGYVPSELVEDWEEWTEARLDIYAVGKIAIQALTGRDPRDLPIDAETGEIIWRFAVPDRPAVQVSHRLAKILDKMISYHSADRYTSVADVLQDLGSPLPPPKNPMMVTWSRFRLLATAGIVGLLLTNGLTIGLLQQQRQDQESRQKESNKLLQDRMAQCNQPIQAKDSNSLTNTDVVQNSTLVKFYCKQLNGIPDISKEQKVTALKNQGKALLLLWQAAARPTAGLVETEKSFQQASALNNSDPQIQFYLGLVQQLKGKPFKDNQPFQQAIKLYLNSSQSQANAEDYVILSRLAILSRLDNVQRRTKNLSQANKLYDKAFEVSNSNQIPPADRVNLLYNQAASNIRDGGKDYIGKSSNILFEAQNIFQDKTQKIDPKSKSVSAVKDFQASCLTTANPFPACSGGSPNLPLNLPVYSCKDYPVLAGIGTSDPSKRDEFCQ